MTIFGNKEIVTNKKTKIKKERVTKEPKLKLEKSASATALERMEKIIKS